MKNSVPASEPGPVGAIQRKRVCSSTLLLFTAGALLLTVIQPPIGWSFLAWVAMAPFAVACSPQAKTRGFVLSAFIIGWLYWLVNIYWIEPITIPGWLAMGLYLSLSWLLPALAVRFARAKGVPLFIALPVIVVGWERLQGFPMGGFFWRLLGHSQYRHLAMIQVADLVGVAGVSFVVAMVNGLIADVVFLMIARSQRVAWANSFARGPVEQPKPREQTPSKEFDGATLAKPPVRTVVVGLLATVAIVSGTLLYGQWRLRQTPEHVYEGPVVGSLQSNVPQSVKSTFSASGRLFDDLMLASKEAAAAGAELIVWPETMVQGILDPALWPQLSGDLDEDKAFHKALCDHARNTSSWLLVGAYGIEILRDRAEELYLGNYNSAYCYRPDGTRDPGRYDKIHLVLFGEYIPFKKQFPWLFRQLGRFLPEGYSLSYSLEHGTRYTVFEMARPGPDPNAITGIGPNRQSPWRFGVIICYEDAIPYVARNFALDEQGRKRVDWLVNISNDGWFVRFPQETGRVIPSTELAQHAAICAFRAVENRLAVVRSVNTGVSCLIESTGRIRDGYLAASSDFPQKAMSRTALAGWFTDRLPIDRRVTFYSRHGEWFANACAAVFVATLTAPLGVRGFRRWSRKAT
ncbi:MAG TPA: apolipoprotein N-acyltransferase [Sedimentisphaerales bacterium]|nr:apolipoprotein N-acyltransferase [Sedimentisphaerales bacterium]HNU30262.1 apolipoprotein N-acyltransferase [Sedimentisphaerales bacterium]